jgi:PAS domain S-box-containing protein
MIGQVFECDFFMRSNIVNHEIEDLLNNARVAIAIVEGPEHIFRFTNLLFEDLFGKRAYLGNPASTVFPEFNSDHIHTICDKVYATGQLFTGKEISFKLDREGNGQTGEYYFSLVVQPFKNNGELERLIIHAVDKTDFVIAKKQIKQGELAFKHLADSMPQIVWIAQADGHVNYYNKKWQEITGIDPNEPKCNSWIRILFPDDLNKCKEAWYHSINTGEIFEMEARFRTINTKESYRWFFIRALPVQDKMGSIQKWFGTCTDIHEYKILLHQKENFLAVASHELKTPVTAIKAYEEVLEATCRKKGYEEEAKLLCRMDKQINKLTILIGDLLDITKIQSGKMQLNESAFDFNQLILEVTEQMKVTSPAHTIDVELSNSKMVFADRNRVGQVISNLLSNAIKYSAENSKIIVRSSTTKTDVFLSVQDFGIGIPKNQLKKLFEQFYRVPGDKQNTFPGFGIGLYISSEIIKRQNGRIWVESIEGKGSTFRFALPIYK